MGEITVFSQMVLGQVDIHMQNTDVRPPTSEHISKINSEWVNDINIRVKITKFLEENR